MTHDSPVEQRYVQPVLLGRIARYGRRELAVIADQNELLGSVDDGDQTRQLVRLRGLVDENMAEAEVLQIPRRRPDASGADDLSVLEHPAKIGVDELE